MPLRMNAPSEANLSISSSQGVPSTADAPTKGMMSVLLPLLTFKAAFFVVALIMIQFFSIWNEGDFAKVRHWPFEGKSTLASRFATWDAAHYLYLAENGYRVGDLSCAFYPLWPALIKLGSFVTGDVFSAGL